MKKLAFILSIIILIEVLPITVLANEVQKNRIKVKSNSVVISSNRKSRHNIFKDIGSKSILRDYNQSFKVELNGQKENTPVHFELIGKDADDLYYGVDKEDKILGKDDDYINLLIHAQDAKKSKYHFILLAKNGNETVDSRAFDLYVSNSFNISVEETGSNPVTMSKTYKITNNGESISDLTVNVNGELALVDEVQHYRLKDGKSINVTVLPKFTDKKDEVSGSLNITGARQHKDIDINIKKGENVESFSAQTIAAINDMSYRADANKNNSKKLTKEQIQNIFKIKLIENNVDQGVTEYKMPNFLDASIKIEKVENSELEIGKVYERVYEDKIEYEILLENPDKGGSSTRKKRSTGTDLIKVTANFKNAYDAKGDVGTIIGSDEVIEKVNSAADLASIASGVISDAIPTIQKDGLAVEMAGKTTMALSSVAYGFNIIKNVDDIVDVYNNNNITDEARQDYINYSALEIIFSAAGIATAVVCPECLAIPLLLGVGVTIFEKEKSDILEYDCEEKKKFFFNQCINARKASYKFNCDCKSGGNAGFSLFSRNSSDDNGVKDLFLSSTISTKPFGKETRSPIIDEDFTYLLNDKYQENLRRKTVGTIYTKLNVNNLVKGENTIQQTNTKTRHKDYKIMGDVSLHFVKSLNPVKNIYLNIGDNVDSEDVINYIKKDYNYSKLKPDLSVNNDSFRVGYNEYSDIGLIGVENTGYICIDNVGLKETQGDIEIIRQEDNKKIYSEENVAFNKFSSENIEINYVPSFEVEHFIVNVNGNDELKTDNNSVVIEVHNLRNSMEKPYLNIPDVMNKNHRYLYLEAKGANNIPIKNISLELDNKKISLERMDIDSDIYKFNVNNIELGKHSLHVIAEDYFGNVNEVNKEIEIKSFNHNNSNYIDNENINADFLIKDNSLDIEKDEIFSFDTSYIRNSFYSNKRYFYGDIDKIEIENSDVVKNLDKNRIIGLKNGSTKAVIYFLNRDSNKEMKLPIIINVKDKVGRLYKISGDLLNEVKDGSRRDKVDISVINNQRRSYKDNITVVDKKIFVHDFNNELKDGLLLIKLEDAFIKVKLDKNNIVLNEGDVKLNKISIENQENDFNKFVLNFGNKSFSFDKPVIKVVNGEYNIYNILKHDHKIFISENKNVSINNSDFTIKTDGKYSKLNLEFLEDSYIKYINLMDENYFIDSEVDVEKDDAIYLQDGKYSNLELGVKADDIDYSINLHDNLDIGDAESLITVDNVFKTNLSIKNDYIYMEPLTDKYGNILNYFSNVDLVCENLTTGKKTVISELYGNMLYIEDIYDIGNLDLDSDYKVYCIFNGDDEPYNDDENTKDDEKTKDDVIVKDRKVTGSSHKKNTQILNNKQRTDKILPIPMNVGDDYYVDIYDHWAKPAVNFVTAAKLFNGIGNRQFAPEMKINKAMITTLLHRLALEPNVQEILPIDVKESDYYANAVRWAKANEIVEIENGYFNGNEEVTRAEIAKMLAKFIDVLNLKFEDRNYTADDLDGLDKETKEAIEKVLKLGVMQGVGNNKFNPNETVTRAEMAQILMNFILQVK